MRVIAGTARGRRLKTLPSRAVRPTADRVKEAVFSMIGSRMPLAGCQVLDLFAGSGALGIEALSRGAAGCVFVERDRRAQAVLRANLGACRFAEVSRVLGRGVDSALEALCADGQSFDLVLADPPYASDPAVVVEAVDRRRVLRAGGLLVLEHDAERVVEGAGETLLTLSRRYGKTSVSLFAPARSDR